MIKFNLKYFIPFLLLLIVEILIEKYATGFIRNTLGDYFVVILLYCFIKSFLKISAQKAALITLIISFIIEFLQLSNLQNIFPDSYSKAVTLILGTSFSFLDLAAYTLGILTVLIVEKLLKKN